MSWKDRKVLSPTCLSSLATTPSSPPPPWPHLTYLIPHTLWQAQRSRGSRPHPDKPGRYRSQSWINQFEGMVTWLFPRKVTEDRGCIYRSLRRSTFSIPSPLSALSRMASTPNGPAIHLNTCVYFLLWEAHCWVLNCRLACRDLWKACG